MINSYTQKLEQIIADMKVTGTTVPDTEYQQWLAFLQAVHPESELLKKRVVIKQCTDIREIMMLAESHNYPTWFIQPKITGLAVTAEYENGSLKTIAAKQQNLVVNKIDGLPPDIPEFNGKVKGVIYMKSKTIEDNPSSGAILEKYLEGQSDQLTFVAYDADKNTSFQNKMQLLESGGVAVGEYVAFPTSKIQSISSTNLETFFQNYIRQASESFPVDGLVIISDVPLDDGDIQYNRVVYRWSPSEQKPF